MHRHLYPTIPHRWLYLPDTYILYPPYFFLKMVLTGGLTSLLLPFRGNILKRLGEQSRSGIVRRELLNVTYNFMYNA